VIQGKLLSPNDFTDLAELERRLHAIQHRYQQTTVPSTAASPRRPHRLPHRLDEHEHRTAAA